MKEGLPIVSGTQQHSLNVMYYCHYLCFPPPPNLNKTSPFIKVFHDLSRSVRHSSSNSICLTIVPYHINFRMDEMFII